MHTVSVSINICCVRVENISLSPVRQQTLTQSGSRSGVSNALLLKMRLYRETSAVSLPHLLLQLVCSTPCIYNMHDFELWIHQHYCSVTHYSICSLLQSTEDLSVSVKAFFIHSCRFWSVLSKSCFIKNAWQLIKPCWQYSAHQNGYIKKGGWGWTDQSHQGNFHLSQ